MKRTMTIEDALIWAYRDELPKTPRRRGPMMPDRGWAEIEAFGELHTVIDEPVNGFGVVEDYLAERRPHPDALIIHNAVVSLDQTFQVEFPADWWPIADLGDLGELGRLAVEQAVAELHAAKVVNGQALRWSPRVIIQRAAIFSRDPDWEIDPPAAVEMRTPNGKPLWFRTVVMPDPYSDVGMVTYEADGYDNVGKRPFPDAYRKETLDPSPVAGIVDRALYEIWRSALDLLFAELDGRLLSLKLTASRRPRRPWEGDEAVGPQVLRDTPTKPVVTSSENRTSG